MSITDFYQEFQASVSSQKMANIEYTSDLLVPNLYSYKKEHFPELEISDFIHLKGGGNISATFPFHFQFSSMESVLLLLTDSGAGRITEKNGREYTVSDRQILIHDCSRPFSLQSIILPWNFKLFFISGNPVRSFCQIFHHYEHYCFSLSDISPVIHCIRTLLSVSPVPNTGEILFMHKNLTVILSLLSASCCPALPPSPSISWYLTEMKDFIDNHLSLTFSLKDFEDRFQINRYRLCREFSSTFGAPPLQYLTQKRLENAKKILLTTDLSIHEISSIIGYDNPNHFINLFKKYENMTPGKFRQKALQEQSVLHCPSPQTSRPT